MHLLFFMQSWLLLFSAFYFKTSIASFAWQVWLFKWSGFCPSQPRMAIYLETCSLAACVGISQWCCCVCRIHDRLGVFIQFVTSSRLLFIRLMLLSVNLAKQSSMVGPKYKYLSFLRIQFNVYEIRFGLRAHILKNIESCLEYKESEHVVNDDQWRQRWKGQRYNNGLG